jgi:copper chaperone CopZ
MANRLTIKGMSCLHCAQKLEKALSDGEGVERAWVSYSRGEAEVLARFTGPDSLEVDESTSGPGDSSSLPEPPRRCRPFPDSRRAGLGLTSMRSLRRSSRRAWWLSAAGRSGWSSPRPTPASPRG